MNTKIKTIIVIVSILIVTVGYGVYMFQKSKLSDMTGTVQQVEQSVVNENTEAQSENTETQPEKTDFGASVPTDFPIDIPLEEGSKVQQSYSLNYDGQKQLSIVFVSGKTVKDNFDLYKDFLEKQDWVLANEYESETLSSLYGNKEQNDINVTISENASTAISKSQVSISVLKK